MNQMVLNPMVGSWWLGGTLNRELTASFALGSIAMIYEGSQFDQPHQTLPWFLSGSLIALHGWCLYRALKSLKCWHIISWVLQLQSSGLTDLKNIFFYCGNCCVVELRICSNYHLSCTSFQSTPYWKHCYCYCCLSCGNEVSFGGLDTYLYV